MSEDYEPSDEFETDDDEVHEFTPQEFYNHVAGKLFEIDATLDALATANNALNQYIVQFGNDTSAKLNSCIRITMANVVLMIATMTFMLGIVLGKVLQ
jgi:hypothetical protein